MNRNATMIEEVREILEQLDWGNITEEEAIMKISLATFDQNDFEGE